MIIAYHDNVGERVFPMVIDDGYLRVGRAKTYLAANTIKSYMCSSDDVWVQYGNNAGDYEFQFSNLYHGTRYVSPNHETTARAWIQSLASCHFLPNSSSLPVCINSNGTMTLSNARYSNGLLDPQRVDAEHAYQNFVSWTPGITISSPWGFYATIGNGWESFFITTNYTSAWYLVLVSGSVTFPENPIVYNDVNESGTNRTSEISSFVKQIYQNDQGTYYLIKTYAWIPLKIDGYFGYGREEWINYFRGIGQPKLRVNFGTNGSCIVIGWGFDIWPHNHPVQS